jgi:hypothetical protein
MSAILQYAKKFIESGKDGTICVCLSTGEIGTLTIINRSIVSATLGRFTGKAALTAIKQSNITDAAFWTDVVDKNNIQRMLQSLKESSALTASNTGINAQSNIAATAAREKPLPTDTLQLSELAVQNLSSALNKFIGPVASIFVEDALQNARSSNDLVLMLAREITDKKDVAAFMQLAYAVVNKAK